MGLMDFFIRPEPVSYGTAKGLNTLQINRIAADLRTARDKVNNQMAKRELLEKQREAAVNAGTVVQVIIPAMNINRSMKIKTFQGDYEGQELDYYYDLEFKEYIKLPQVKVKAKKYITVKKRDPKPVSKPSTSKNKKKTAIKKGDKVQFKGGPVYISSDASRPTVTRGKAKCNCTIVNSNKHPYHLIHYSGAMVYGWVNASDCEKI